MALDLSDPKWVNPKELFARREELHTNFHMTSFAEDVYTLLVMRYLDESRLGVAKAIANRIRKSLAKFIQDSFRYGYLLHRDGVVSAEAKLADLMGDAQQDEEFTTNLDKMRVTIPAPRFDPSDLASPFLVLAIERELREVQEDFSRLLDFAKWDVALEEGPSYKLTVSSTVRIHNILDD